MKIKRQTRLLYLYEALICFRMVDAVWVIFLLGRGYSLAEVGIAEGVYHITSMIFEVPSGMAADLFGRKRTLTLSGIVGMCSALFMSLEGWSGWIYPGMICSALSLNLASGTEEALTYDSLLMADRADRYKKVSSDMSIIGRISSAVSCTMSPVAIAIGYRYTYYLSAFISLCGILSVAGLQEPILTSGQQKRESCGFHEIGSRWKKHIAETFSFIRKHPRVIVKLFADAAIACPCFLIMMYLQEHLVNCGWPERWIGIPMVLLPLAGAVGAWAASASRSGILKTAMLCGILGGIGTCLTGTALIGVILAGACMARGCEGFASIMIGENVNRDFSSDQRATLISVDSLLYSVLMVIASPLTGFLGNRYSVSVVFYVLGGGLLAATAGMTILMKRRQ